jgi:hypothetical protein
MRIALIVVIGLILALSGASAYEFTQIGKTNKNGAIYTKTNIGGAKNLVEGYGDITVRKTVSLEDASSVIDSYFRLKDGRDGSYDGSYGSFRANGTNRSDWMPTMPGFVPNRYVIAMSSPNRMSHGLSVYGTTDLSSNSEIKFMNQQVNTNYNVAASGELNELVLDGSKGKTATVSETWMSGKGFIYNSSFNDKVPMGTDRDMLLSSINETVMSTEKTFIEPATPLEGANNALIAIGIAAPKTGESNNAGTFGTERTCEGTGCDTTASDSSSSTPSSASGPNPVMASSGTGVVMIIGQTNETAMPFIKAKIGNYTDILLSSECDNSVMPCENYHHIRYPPAGISSRDGGSGTQVAPFGAKITIVRKPIEALRGV